MKGGIGGYYSSAFSYKKTAFLAEGFALYAEVLYGKGGWERYLSGKWAFQINPFLVNFQGYHWDGENRYEAFLLPNLFNPKFPDINIGILPPPSRHFVSILYLLRIYPSLFYDGNVGFMLFGDFQFLGNLVFSLGFGYSVYPRKGFKLLVM
jgi:hypothetical protein